MDSWLQRLVVRGPGDDVKAFRKAAASPAKPLYVTIDAQHRTQRLSFLKLLRSLPPRLARNIGEMPEEPWDLAVEPQRRLPDGTTSVTYRFQLARFLCEDLIVAVSRLYPRLCFVLGTVAPNDDDQSSMLIRNGKPWRWSLPQKRKQVLFAKIVPEKTDDNADEVDWPYVEMDSAMMDEVVDHWNSKVEKMLSGSKK